jgi:hypothetical protein
MAILSMGKHPFWQLFLRKRNDPGWTSYPEEFLKGLIAGGCHQIVNGSLLVKGFGKATIFSLLSDARKGFKIRFVFQRIFQPRNWRRIDSNLSSFLAQDAYCIYRGVAMLF